jgi:lipoteichoic acid synthase
LKKLSLIGILTFLSLASKSIFTRYQIISGLEIAGVTIELSFLLLIVLLTTFFHEKASSLLYVFINIAGSFFLLTAIMYFDYYNSILTYKSLAQARQVGAIKESIYALFRVEYLCLFADFLLLLLWPRIKSLARKHIYIRKKLFIFFLAANVLILTWGFYRASHMISETNQYDTLGFFSYQLLEASIEIGFIINDRKQITSEMVAQKKPSKSNESLRLTGIAKNKNVIIVQLESVQSLLLNKSIDGVEVTPNLNRLINDSYFFPNFYTQVGKGNTSDAEFIVNSSIYALGDESMSAATAGKVVPGLPRKLKEAGYYTATFHANEISFWSRKEMYEALGFEQYFDQDYFGKEDFIAYGVSDEILYKKTVEKLTELGNQKFYAHIIALSSHYPYDLPPNKIPYVIKLPEAYDDSIVGSYIKSVSYADVALGVLFEELKAAGLYEDSIIVVYGDHQGVQTKNERDIALVNELVGHDYQSVLDHLNVPLIIKVPSIDGGEKVTTVGGLVDVYPTLANLLGMDISNEIVFGTDLINAKTNTIGIRFYAPTGTFVTNEYAFSPGKMRDSGKIIDTASRQVRPASSESLKVLEKVLDYMELADVYVKSLD